MFAALLMLILSAAPPSNLTAAIGAGPSLEIYQLDRNPDLTLTLPHTGRSIVIAINDYPLWPDEYTVSGLTITLRCACVESDEIITATIIR